MSDYFTTRLDLLARNGVEVDRATPQTMVDGLQALNADPLGQLVLKQVEEVLTAESRLETACGRLERSVHDTRLSVQRGAAVYESTVDTARDFDLAIEGRKRAWDALADLAGLWTEQTRLANLPLMG